MARSIWRLKLLAIALTSASLNSPAVADAGETIARNSIKTVELAVQHSAYLLAFPDGLFAQEPKQKYRRIADTMSAAQLKKIEVVFPKEIRRYGRSVGPLRVAKLTIVVGTDGKARDVQIAQSSGFDPYDKAALSAAKEATYVPAMNNGAAVESRLDYDISFQLLCNKSAGDHTCDHGRYATECSATSCALLTR
jgi:TonB family protein